MNHVVDVGGVTLLSWCMLASGSNNAVNLNNHDLGRVSGGISVWCSRPEIDPNGVDCDECEISGLVSWKCNSIQRDETWSYQKEQIPAKLHEEVQYDCGPDKLIYLGHDCIGKDPAVSSCDRDYDHWNFVMGDTNVNCP